MKWTWLAALMLLGTAGAAAQPGGGRFPRLGKSRPTGQIEKFSRLTPEQRRRVIEQLPPDRQREVERNFEHYQSLSPRQRSILNSELEVFRSLPGDKQQHARRIYRDIHDLPEERRALIRREMARMRSLSPAGRKARWEGDEFKERFAENERQIIRDLAELMPAP